MIMQRLGDDAEPFAHCNGAEVRIAEMLRPLLQPRLRSSNVAERVEDRGEDVRFALAAPAHEDRDAVSVGQLERFHREMNESSRSSMSHSLGDEERYDSHIEHEFVKAICRYVLQLESGDALQLLEPSTSNSARNSRLQRLKGTMIELTNASHTGAIEQSVSSFLEITYPSVDLIKCFEGERD
jgi:hypothetical protein